MFTNRIGLDSVWMFQYRWSIRGIVKLQWWLSHRKYATRYYKYFWFKGGGTGLIIIPIAYGKSMYLLRFVPMNGNFKLSQKITLIGNNLYIITLHFGKMDTHHKGGMSSCKGCLLMLFDWHTNYYIKEVIMSNYSFFMALFCCLLLIGCDSQSSLNHEPLTPDDTTTQLRDSLTSNHEDSNTQSDNSSNTNNVWL